MSRKRMFNERKKIRDLEIETELLREGLDRFGRWRRENIMEQCAYLSVLIGEMGGSLPVRSKKMSEKDYLESLRDCVRIGVKYNVYDLRQTGRELEYLRNLLEKGSD